MKHFSLVLALLLAAFTTALAQRTVTGTVMDENNDPVIGANIVLKGTTNGVATDFDGKFKLDVPKDAKTIVVSYIGYPTKEVDISATNNVMIQLTASGVTIGEVVVVGYGQRKKEELVANISVVGTKDIEMVPLATFDNILQGKAPGLQIFAGSGQPGVAAGRVTLRGPGSISSDTEPIYIMDGVQIDKDVLSNINPNDIESVSVLKDASTTSIYGARAANGVILITTKRGKFDAPTRITYRTQYGLSVRSREQFEMMNSAEKLAFERYAGELGVNAARTRPGFRFGSETSAAFNQALYDSLAAVNTDWREYFFRTGSQRQHDLSASGGSETTRFYVGAQYFQQDGIAIRSDLERGTLRFNVENKASERLTFSLNSTVGYSRRNFIERENAVNLGNPFAAVYLNNPYESPYLANGEFALTGLANAINVLELTESTDNTTDELKGVGNLSAEYAILSDKSLNFRTSWGIDFTEQTGERFIDPNSVLGRDASQIPGGQGSFGQTYFRQTQYQGNASLNYRKYFQERHKLDVLLGAEVLNQQFTNFSFTGYGIDPRLPNTGAGITPGTNTNNFIPSVDGGNTTNRLASFFTRLEYSLDSKYNFTAGARRDGSSRFGANYRWGNFYNVGASWVLSEEDFIKNGASWIDYLLVGVSYGTTGSEALGNFQARSLYSPSVVYGGGLPSQVVSQIGSPDLKWEVSNQLNISVAYTLLKGRFNGTIDLYNNVTSDLFIQQNLSLAASGGIGALNVNAGTMRNRGVEAGLTVNLINTADLNWSFNGNFSYNDNEILDLGQVDEFEQGTSIIRVGEMLGSHYVVEWAGVDPATGQPLYYDLNGNVTTLFSDANRVSNFGSFYAPWSGGFGTDLSYKGFSVSAFFSFVQGNTLFNNQTFFQENHNFSQFNLSTLMNDVWRNPGDIAEAQGIVNPETGGISVRQFSSKDLEDGSFLRFRNLTLAYAFPSDMLGNAVSGIRVFAQAQNLFTFTRYTGFDPEIDNNIAQYEYPVPRIYTVGLDITF